MKKTLEDFLMIEEVDPKAVLYITLGTVLAFPIGYFIVFAPPLWWQ